MEEVKQDTQSIQTQQQEFDKRTFGAPVEEGPSKDNLAVAEAFSAQGEETVTVAPQEGIPTETQEAVQSTQPQEAKNDARRFEYWQSQSAKRENEVKLLRQQLEAVETVPSATAQVPQQQTEPEVQEFPPPPPRPEKPRGFSREEAISDLQSESAQYMDSIDSWRDDMTQYSELKNQYEVAILQERLDNQDKERQEALKQREIQTNVQRQQQEIYERVTEHYGFNDVDARDFMQTMSKPESITMDNLVSLYRMQKGVPMQNPAAAGPSDTFTQTQNAQSIPSPMGVVTGAGNVDTRPEGEQIIDDLVNSYNSRNPWS